MHVVVANGMQASVVILSDLIAIGSRRWLARVDDTREEWATACSRSSVTAHLPAPDPALRGYFGWGASQWRMAS
jgi:hypothetical protein